jgi:ribosome biogenesis GTPase
MKLESLGWNNYFEAFFAPYTGKGLVPGRISVQHKDRYIVYTEQGELAGQVRGKFRFDTEGIHDFHHVLERRSKFSRKVAGEKTDEQILAANIDIAFLVVGLDANYNPRRLERYLTVAWESGARTVIILNKSDKCDDAEEKHAEVAEIAKGTDILMMSAKNGTGVEPLRDMLTYGITGVLLGSSGVGKSTITNYLLGTSHAKIREVRESDDRGRHATSHRELLLLPSGGLIIDSPGLRELQLWGGEEGIQDSFDDIIELGLQCRFRDCKHDAEPDCAVKQSLENGTLEAGRYESYLKLQKEIAYRESRSNATAQRVEKERWKKISKEIKTKYHKRDKP